MNDFYLLVVGSRTITDYNVVSGVIEYFLGDIPMTHHIHIVTGGAKGVDELAEQYAKECDYDVITFKLDKKDWYKTDPRTGNRIYNRAAGYQRNRKMHEYIAQFPSRAVIALWDGESKGTLHSKRLAQEYNNQIRFIDYPLLVKSISETVKNSD